MPARPAEQALDNPEARRIQLKRMIAQNISRGFRRHIVIENVGRVSPQTSRSAAVRLYREVMGEFEADYQRDIPYYRTQQLIWVESSLERILTSDLGPDGKVDPKRRVPWNSALQFIRLHAELTGTLKREDDEFEGDIKKVLNKVVAGMSKERLAVMTTEGVDVDDADD